MFACRRGGGYVQWEHMHNCMLGLMLFLKSKQIILRSARYDEGYIFDLLYFEARAKFRVRYMVRVRVMPRFWMWL
jgi:hypothetical protein